MQNWNKFLLVSSGFLFFAAVFVLSCILKADISENQDNRVVISLLRQNESKATEGNEILSIASKIVCYLTIPGKKDSTMNLIPTSVDPNLCTHLIVGFANVVNCSIDLGNDIHVYKDAIKLKNKNPELKVMISVMGMQETSGGFPEMTRNHANRKVFIRSVLAITKSLRLDGLDVDWEFPAWLNPASRQRIHFVQLLQELKKAFTRSGQKLLLSAAVSASDVIIDESYNVPEMAEHVDFVNLMTYDYRFYSRWLSFTGLNAPLFSDPADTGLWLNMNVNYSANYWLEIGMPKDKIIVGIPTYGHSFNLNNVYNNGLKAPCNGFGSLGFGGFVSYTTICSFIKNGATQIFSNNSRVPYAFQDHEWISYDNIVSVTEKANWIRSNKFGGAMIFSLNTDDWNRTCDGNSSFPLTRAIRKIIENDLEVG